MGCRKSGGLGCGRLLACVPHRPFFSACLPGHRKSRERRFVARERRRTDGSRLKGSVGMGDNDRRTTTTTAGLGHASTATRRHWQSSTASYSLRETENVGAANRWTTKQHHHHRCLVGFPCCWQRRTPSVVPAWCGRVPLVTATAAGITSVSSEQQCFSGLVRIRYKR